MNERLFRRLAGRDACTARKLFLIERNQRRTVHLRNPQIHGVRTTNEQVSCHFRRISRQRSAKRDQGDMRKRRNCRRISNAFERIVLYARDCRSNLHKKKGRHYYRFGSVLYRRQQISARRVTVFARVERVYEYAGVDCVAPLLRKARPRPAPSRTRRAHD